MSKTLILTIAIFTLWIFISISKNINKEEKEDKKDFFPADDNILYASFD